MYYRTCLRTLKSPSTSLNVMSLAGCTPPSDSSPPLIDEASDEVPEDPEEAPEDPEEAPERPEVPEEVPDELGGVA